jgi:type III secretion protein L
MRERCEAALEAAHADADALRAEAATEAGRLVAQAEARYADAAHAGREEGLRHALADWHARVAQAPAADGTTPAQQQRKRLAELVVLAVEQIVAASDPADLFRRAATALDRIVSDGSPLDVRVHPAELAAATQAFGECGKAWRDAGRAVRLRVRGDAALEPGACVCESDLGAVNASLDLQLAAMRDAIARAMHSVADDDAITQDGASLPEQEPDA